MSVEIIPDDDGRGFSIAVEEDEVEFVDPIKHLSESEIRKRTILRKATSKLQGVLPDAYFLWAAKRSWEEQYKEVVATPIPPNFLKLFDSQSKAEQERLLDGASLTPFQLCNLFFIGATRFGCTYSNYLTEKLPNGIEEKDLPKIARIEGDKIVKVGATTLTDGQLKNLINHRKVIVAKFLDNKNGWHCFYQTYKGVSGEEKGATGRPHLHYLSDKWAIPRDTVVQQIKEGNAPTTKIHIDLHGYRP